MKNVTVRKLLMWFGCMFSASYLILFLMNWKPNLNIPRLTLIGNEAEIVVVGAGLSGAIIAHLHATLLGKKVFVVEKNNYVGGSCYDYVDKLGIRVSKYGFHVLHTNNTLVLQFLSQFSEWIPYEHRVVAKIKEQYVPFPLNIDFINTIFNMSITNSKEMIKWLKYNAFAKTKQDMKQLIKGGHRNLKQEEKTIKENADDKMMKQKEKGIKEKADDMNNWINVFQSLKFSPDSFHIRHNFDDRYFPDVYTALPADGYTSVITRMLNHPLITVALNVDFNPLENNGLPISKLFFTGRIDKYFENSGLQELKYRRVVFETIHTNTTLSQPNVVMLYPQTTQHYTTLSQPNVVMTTQHYSRFVEYRHVTNPRDAGTTVVREYHGNRGHPYIPISDDHDIKLYRKYKMLAQEELKRKVYFVGGLGQYKYFSIGDTVINVIADFKKAYPEMSFLDSDIFPKTVTNVTKSKNGNLSIAFITSHCKEPLSWISHQVAGLCLQYDVSIFIYEKCGRTNKGKEFIEKHPECTIQQILLPNVGREGHSWLHHMMTQQAWFSDINLFLQGGKEVSKRELFNTINRMKKLNNLNSPSYLETPPRMFRAHYVPFSENRHCFDITKGALNWTIEEILERTCDYFYMITKTRERCTEYIANYRGEFAVTGALLHRMLARHRDVISRWYDDLSKQKNPLQGHLVERSWTLLFSHPDIPRC